MALGASLEGGRISLLSAQRLLAGLRTSSIVATLLDRRMSSARVPAT
jgi:hypothetical protein